MFSSADESLKDETRLLLLWDGSLVKLYFFSSVYIKKCLLDVIFYQQEIDFSNCGSKIRDLIQNLKQNQSLFFDAINMS